MKKIASAMITNPANEPTAIPIMAPVLNPPRLFEQPIVEMELQHLVFAVVKASPN